MDQQRFDRVTAALVSGVGRRRAVAGLVAGTAAMLGRGVPAGAKRRKKKKKCTFCPQRSCCSCRAVAQGPAATCFLIEGLSQADAQTKCIKACGGPDFLFTVNTPVAGVTNVCAADHSCAVKQCPIKVTA